MDGASGGTPLLWNVSRSGLCCSCDICISIIKTGTHVASDGKTQSLCSILFVSETGAVGPDDEEQRPPMIAQRFRSDLPLQC